MKIVKGLPFLVAGVATLGLVGVTVLAPVANAAETATGNITVNANVAQGTGIVTPGGGKDDSTDQTNPTLSVNGSNATLDFALSAPDYQEGQVTVKGTTNAPNGLNITLKDSDTTTGLVAQGIDTPIIAKDGQPKSGTASWAVNVNGTDWKAIPASNETGLAVGEGSTAKGTYTAPVKVAVATANDTAEGQYTDTMQYTVSINQ